MHVTSAASGSALPWFISEKNGRNRETPRPASTPAYIASPPIVGVGIGVNLAVVGFVDRTEAHDQPPNDGRPDEGRPGARQENPEIGDHASLSVRSVRRPRGNRRAVELTDRPGTAA